MGKLNKGLTLHSWLPTIQRKSVLIQEIEGFAGRDVEGENKIKIQCKVTGTGACWSSKNNRDSFIVVNPTDS